jgi:hypothetical protein
MALELVFPSKEWCLAAAKALHADPTVQAAVAEFGGFTAGTVIDRGDGLGRDFCVLVAVEPGEPPHLTFCDDEDELEEFEPDYLGHVPHRLVRDLLRAAQSGLAPDPLKLITSGQVRVQGDLGRVVRVAGRYPNAGLEAIRSIPTRTLG